MHSHVNEEAVSLYDIMFDIEYSLAGISDHTLDHVQAMLKKELAKYVGKRVDSSPSSGFLSDWIARQLQLVKANQDGMWERLPSDCWHTVGIKYPNSDAAYNEFWRLLRIYTRLKQRLIANWQAKRGDVNYSMVTEQLLSIEVIQLYPEPGVYLVATYDSPDSILGIKKWTLGFYNNWDCAKEYANNAFEISFGNVPPDVKT